MFIIIFIIATLVALSFFYVVVEPNKAHVVVQMGQGRKIYSPSKVITSGPNGEKTEKTFKTAYLFIPFLMKRIIVSLENVKHEINDIKLHDSQVAPFKCDTTCWFKIINPDLAAEKLNVGKDGNIMDSVRETLDASVMGIARAAAMKQEVIELMRDRKTLGEGVLKEVNGDLDEWGVQLVKLEIIDFSDAENSQVIADHQDRIQAKIKSETRIIVAKEEQEASVEEHRSKQIIEKARIESTQAVAMQEIEKQESLEKRSRVAQIAIEQQTQKANEQKVKAQKTLQLGQAQIKADAVEVEAKGTANAIKLEAEANAEAKKKTGQAEADIIEAKGLAKAEATSKQADAQKKFTDVSKDIEFAKIAKEIEIAKYQSLSEALKNANVNIVSDDMSFMGFNAKDGAGMGSLLQALKQTSGIELDGLVKSIADKIEKK